MPSSYVNWSGLRLGTKCRNDERLEGSVEAFRYAKSVARSPSGESQPRLFSGRRFAGPSTHRVLPSRSPALALRPVVPIADERADHAPRTNSSACHPSWICMDWSSELVLFGGSSTRCSLKITCSPIHTPLRHGWLLVPSRVRCSANFISARNSARDRCSSSRLRA